MRIKITLRELEILLQEQKRNVIDRISVNSYMYNTESTDAHARPLPIDKDKMKKVGMDASFPEEFNILKKYIVDSD